MGNEHPYQNFEKNTVFRPDLKLTSTQTNFTREQQIMHNYLEQ